MVFLASKQKSLFKAEVLHEVLGGESIVNSALCNSTHMLLKNKTMFSVSFYLKEKKQKTVIHVVLIGTYTRWSSNIDYAYEFQNDTSLALRV